jgi:hypothetical protein
LRAAQRAGSERVAAQEVGASLEQLDRAARVVILMPARRRFTVAMEVVVVPVLGEATGACRFEAELVLVPDQAPAANETLELLLVFERRARWSLVAGYGDEQP